MDSEGLLLLGDEPGFNHFLLDPQYAHERTYWVQVEGEISATALAGLAAGGLVLQGHRTLPCRAAALAPPALPPRDPPVRFRKAIPTSWLEIALIEGKNRQVRRMTAAVGFPTLRLFRSAIGDLRWAGEAAGSWRELSAAERQSLLRKKS